MLTRPRAPDVTQADRVPRVTSRGLVPKSQDQPELTRIAKPFMPLDNRLLPIIFSAIFMAGCAGQQRPVSSPQLVVTKDSILPAPSRRDLLAPDRPSLIGPFDKVQIDVFNVPELSREVQVDASGRVSLPLIGSVDAGGKTSDELAREITQQLGSRYVRNPFVTVNLQGSVSQVVTVDGEVNEPGLYPVSNQMTLMRAISSAKGVSDVARLQDVVILRTVEGQRMAGLYNLAAIRMGAYADPVIYANDVIVVGDSPQRRFFKNLVAFSPAIAAPIVAIVQR
jgi:polysaccharide biosynthesis/export protein